MARTALLDIRGCQELYEHRNGLRFHIDRAWAVGLGFPEVQPVPIDLLDLRVQELTTTASGLNRDLDEGPGVGGE